MCPIRKNLLCNPIYFLTYRFTICNFIVKDPIVSPSQTRFHSGWRYSYCFTRVKPWSLLWQCFTTTFFYNTSVIFSV